MRFWKTILKRSLLALAAVGVALSWTQTGYTQSPCTIGRGQDPLDVLNSGVRHNVWIVLDTSGSMSQDMSGGATSPNKMTIAKQVLTEVIDEFVDSSGRPVVNWGFVKFGSNSAPSSSDICDYQFLKPSTSAPGNAPNGCVGLNLNGLINPPPCTAPSNASSVKAAINAASPSGNTPNGIAMDQISQRIVANGFVASLLPNQKNFVILVTDGDDTCECNQNSRSQAGLVSNGVWTPTPVPPFASGTAVPRMLRGGTANWNYTINVGTNSADIQAANAGTKGRLLYERLNPTAADRATGAKGGSFVIGMGTSGISPARAHHMAWEASGAFYGNPTANYALLASNRTALKNALRDAFAKIGVPASTVTLGAPTVGTVPEVVPQYTNPTLSPGELQGDVNTPDPDDIREARTNRANHQDNVVFSSSVDVPGFKGHFRAYNIYRVTDPNNPRTARAADYTEIWDAGGVLQQRSPDSRNILFNRRGETLLRPFTTAQVTAADLGVTTGFLNVIDGIGARTANDARDMVVGVVRGYRLSKHPLTGTLYTPSNTINFTTTDQNGQPTWKLYDAVAAPAIVQSPPRSPDFDPPLNHPDKYGVGANPAQVGNGFYWDRFNRRTMVYLPTNGGMIHGFDGETGDEVFAYVPDDVMGFAPGEVAQSRDTLADFVTLVVAENNGITNHQFNMSGPPTVKDAFLRSDFGGDDEWHTMLTFGRGRGGRFLSGLDITDPANPVLRFNIGNREGLSDGLLDGLGETWSAPVQGNVAVSNPTANPDRADQWLAFFGGGYGCNNASFEGQYLFAVRLENGSVYHRSFVNSDPSAVIPYNAVVALPVLYNPHTVDVADGKDFITRVYVGDVQGYIWKLVTTATNPTSWTLRKFAAVGRNQPITVPVTLMNDPNNQQVFVMVGSGGDARVPQAGNTFKFAAFADRDPEGANTTQYPLGSTPLWSRDLNPGERTYVPAVTVGTFDNTSNPIVFFAASSPGFNTQTCTGFFDSTLYGLEMLSGTASVDLDGNGGNDASLAITNTKISGLYASGELYVSESGGLGGTGKLSVYGDGDFSDNPTAGGSGLTIQVLVDGFRISPF
jgi:hypothetical protein